jgi:capsule polysaccharide modification protein KpsS
MTFPKSVDSIKFSKYLEALRKKHKQRRILLFFDQLSVHWSAVTKAKMRELDIKWMFNASYSPDFNCVEGAIGLTKTLIKRERLRALALNQPIDLDKVIKSSFMSLKKSICLNFIKASNELLF